VRRVSVVGVSGSGKSWLASKVASVLSSPYLELDAVRHQPGWRELPDAEFLELVSGFVEQDRWVVDGNYFSVVTEQAVWPVADTVVWVDLPRAAVMRQVMWRTVKRGVLRQELWNGNRESLRDMFRWDPYKSIIRWSWTSYGTVRERCQAAMSDGRSQHLEFIRLRSQSEMRRFLDNLDPPA
jgi:adenylate kinase family enzyme